MGSGNCSFWAPGVFDLDDDGIAIVVDPAAQPDDKIVLAAQGCPTQAIAIVATASGRRPTTCVGARDMRMPIGITEEHEQLRRPSAASSTTRIPASVLRAALDARSADAARVLGRARRTGLDRAARREAHGARVGLVEQAVVVEELGRACAPGPYVPTAIVAALLASRRRPGGDASCCRSSRRGELTGAVARRRRDARRSAARVADVDRVRGRRRVVRARRRRRLARREVAERRSDAPARPHRPRRCRARPPADRQLAIAHVRPRARDRGRAVRGRGDRHRAVVRRHRGRVREGARAVRPADRAVPGREAPLRRDAGAHRARPRRRCGTRPRAADDVDDAGTALAIAAAAALAFDAAFANAKDCVQTLGGIGFTWEHDAHIYLRRAMTLHQLAGTPDDWRVRAAQAAMRRRPPAARASTSPRRGRGATATSCARSSPRSRTLAAREQRGRLADAGYITPGWPAPWGRDADALELLVIEEEFRAAKVRAARTSASAAGRCRTSSCTARDEQQERWIMPTLRGEIGWCQLFSEPGAGSDLASLSTRARRASKAAGCSTARRCGRRWRRKPTGASASRAPTPTRRSTTASRASWST